MDQSDSSIDKRLSNLEAAVREIKHLLQVSQEVEHSQSESSVETSKIPENTAIAPSLKPGLREKEVKRVSLANPLQPASPPPPPPMPTEREKIPERKVISSPSFKIPDHMKTGEYWLNKAGIGLILFGVLFAFKYSVEQGWINPPVRHLFGLLVSFLLIGFGFKTYTKQRHFSLVLLGGSIGAFYMTGFSAYQLYSLVSHPLAMGYMIVITSLAFTISIRQNEPILSLIGTIGGLGTPFLLYSGSNNVEGLIVYISLILTATGVIYFYKGWRSLLWISVIGGWIVLSIAVDSLDNIKDIVDSKHWSVQAGLIFAWLIFWAMPVFREVAWAANPERWSRSTIGFADKLISQSAMKMLDRHVHMLTITSPIAALVISLGIWQPNVNDNIFGSCSIAIAIIYSAVSYYLKRRQPLTVLAQTHIAVAILFLTFGFIFLIDGNSLLIVLATEGLIFQVVARRINDKVMRVGSHALFVIISFWMLDRLTSSGNEPAIINKQSLIDLFVIGSALSSAWVLKRIQVRNIYLLGVHLALLAWMSRELSSLEDGQGYLTIAWGVYAIVLLLFGLRRDIKRVRQVALATIMLVVGKLFLVDLSRLETIWRVLLFVGFGGLLLILSYFFRSLWKGKSDQELKVEKQN